MGTWFSAALSTQVPILQRASHTIYMQVTSQSQQRDSTLRRTWSWPPCFEAMSVISGRPWIAKLYRALVARSHRKVHTCSHKDIGYLLSDLLANTASLPNSTQRGAEYRHRKHKTGTASSTTRSPQTPACICFQTSDPASGEPHHLIGTLRAVRYAMGSSL